MFRFRDQDLKSHGVALGDACSRGVEIAPARP